jgi:hypothetical protein
MSGLRKKDVVGSGLESGVESRRAFYGASKGARDCRIDSVRLAVGETVLVGTVFRLGLAKMGRPAPIASS